MILQKLSKINNKRLKNNGGIIVLNTYKSFLPISNYFKSSRSKSNLDLSDLSIEYQKSHNSFIFAYTYCKLFPYMKTVADQYFHLTDDDKSSFILEELQKCLLTYKPTQAKFITMVNTYIKRRLYAESSMENHQKRCANNIGDSFDELCATKESYEFRNEADLAEMEVAISQIDTQLTETEVKYCKIVIRNNTKLYDREIAKEIGITGAGVSYIKRCLQEKLTPLLLGNLTV